MKRKTFNLKVLLLASALVFSNINAIPLSATTIRSEDGDTLVAKVKKVKKVKTLVKVEIKILMLS